MLSYQHAFHAGNLADLQKHALLAELLSYLTKKDKPLTYIETHAGRGLYDLTSDEAVKTGEAAQGIGAHAGIFGQDHPYLAALDAVRREHGPNAYPGSPLIASKLLRPKDKIHLAELHPQEHQALTLALRAPNVTLHRQDGFALAHSLCPPEPRRGVLLVDPPYELKQDYVEIPKFFRQINKKWNVGVLALWYPILSSAAHVPMLAALTEDFPDALCHEIRFPPVRENHRMIGSGMFVVNPPWGLSEAASALTDRLRRAKAAR
ncbi:23S rRNA (adenine(2030)-N(6))-methyltransferase RlmJ [Salipiger sp. PrR002]|uniref:23S rRNA (adenine(2030)-N(6))-methyltransferase RlmJ n=1 Tax=Salipiger sp. PrR002 TaxID=2706489 RepID=UPI0013BE76C0|nr:23S rRNA (adenine(2030)-N(6))-methyltransferase RlmJ [Salipiger sp. PrR002]NDV98678.1 23S rRNA (adenine(2030)-N(6))-methyltransferase RlmJ [Salipiger sp. PrR002]NDW57514.1 23S rRNA (adenine(2030)-N(6))-methyltransferase RlmJ [Salipiger sp. PrR004]